MRRLIVASLLISFCLAAVSPAVEIYCWKGKITGNFAAALSVARSGAAPDITLNAQPSVKWVDQPAWGDDYVGYIAGFLMPPQDGDYTFYVSSDDDSALYLSPDDKIANGVVIASLTGWAGADNWLTGGSATRVSKKATLKAGQKYAFCYVMREGTGGDNGSVGWTGPGIGDGKTITVVAAQYVDDGLAAPEAPVFASAKGGNAVVGGSATLSVTMGAMLRPWLMPLAWYKVADGGDVKVGDGASYKVAAVADADEGSYYCAAGDVKSPVVFLDAQHGLVHRYTFNEADVDSIIIKDVLNQEGDNAGAFDAMLYDLSGKDKFDKDGLTLGNTTQTSGAANASYVDLPNGLFSSLGTQFTIETWYTQITGGIWQRIFDIGTANGGEDKSDGGGNTAYFYLCPAKGGTGDETLWYGYKTNNSAGMNNSEANIGGQNNGGWRVPKNVEKFYAVTWDEINGVTKMYYQGVPMGHLKTRSSIRNAVQFVDNNVWLGRSQWGDTGAGGRYNEFRVWDVALSAAEIARHMLVGPDDASMAPAGACGTLATRQTLDVNGDCNVDLVDYAVLIGQWLDSIPQTPGNNAW